MFTTRTQPNFTGSVSRRSLKSVRKKTRQALPNLEKTFFWFFFNPINFQNKKFFRPKFYWDPNFFANQIFSRPRFLETKKISERKFFWNPNFLWSRIFFNPKFFLDRKSCLVKKHFCVKKILIKKVLWSTFFWVKLNFDF